MRKIILVAFLIIGVVAVASALLLFSQTQNQQITTTFQSTPQFHRFITEYPTQSESTSPNAIAVDSSGHVWFALWNQTAIGELFPSNGTIREFQLPEPKSMGLTTWGMVSDNTSGSLWFTDANSNSIWKFNMANESFTKYPLPTKNAFPFEIALDKSGNVWFTEEFANKIGEIIQGTVTETAVPLKVDSTPVGIAIDNQNRVWFTLANANELGSLYGGHFDFYNKSDILASPVGLAIDSIGNLWITQHGPNFVSEFNPKTGYFRTISTSAPTSNRSLPYFIQVDASNNVWFNEHQGNAMAEFIPSSNKLIEYVVPSRIASVGNISGMLTMGLSPQGQPWFVEFFAGKVGAVNLSAIAGLANKMDISSSSKLLVVSKGTTATVHLSLVNNNNLTINLKSSVGNFTGSTNFSMMFSPNTGTGEFGSTLKIENLGSKSGVYFLTISAETNDLIVSQIVELKVP